MSEKTRCPDCNGRKSYPPARRCRSCSSKLQVVTDRPGCQDPVEQWLPLVHWVIRHKLSFRTRRSLGDDDCFQAGVEGLLKAKRLYDPARGVSFKTYAAEKIHWAILIASGLGRHGWEREPEELPEWAS